MKHDIAKRSASSRRAWRTRKRMKAARLQAFEDARARNMKLQKGLRALASDKYIREFVDYLKPEVITGQLGPETGHNEWPAYMTRALPNPWNIHSYD